MTDENKMTCAEALELAIKHCELTVEKGIDNHIYAKTGIAIASLNQAANILRNGYMPVEVVEPIQCVKSGLSKLIRCGNCEHSIPAEGVMWCVETGEFRSKMYHCDKWELCE